MVARRSARLLSLCTAVVATALIVGAPSTASAANTSSSSRASDSALKTPAIKPISPFGMVSPFARARPGDSDRAVKASVKPIAPFGMVAPFGKAPATIARGARAVARAPGAAVRGIREFVYKAKGEEKSSAKVSHNAKKP